MFCVVLEIGSKRLAVPPQLASDKNKFRAVKQTAGILFLFLCVIKISRPFLFDFILFFTPFVTTVFKSECEQSLSR